MSFSQFSDMQIGAVTVATSKNGGHSMEFFAETVVNRLMSISELAPEPIKAQALEYRNAMLAIVLDGIKRAVESDRAYRK